MRRFVTHQFQWQNFVYSKLLFRNPNMRFGGILKKRCPVTRGERESSTGRLYCQNFFSVQKQAFLGLNMRFGGEILKNRPQKARGTRHPPTNPHPIIYINSKTLSRRETLLQPVIMATRSDLTKILLDSIQECQTTHGWTDRRVPNIRYK